MKVFISQPMINKPNDILYREREAVVKQLKAEGYEVIDSILDIPNATPLLYLAKSVELMNEADGVVFMKGWEQSRGCTMEHDIAVLYGKFVKLL